MSEDPYLTKSSYVSAHQCERWLWNDFHNRLPYEKPAPGSSADIGNRIGRLARDLFPGGALVSGFLKKHDEAVAATLALMSDKNVPAIYEAAFEHNGVRVRVDILERLEGNAWGIREVKSASSIWRKVKYAPLEEKYAIDLAVQCAVLRGAGVDVQSARLVFVNSDNVLERAVPTAEGFFRQAELLDEIGDLISEVSIKSTHFLAVLNSDTQPDIEPAKSKCGKLGGSMCPFWESCTADKPDDWVDALYFPVRGQLAEIKKSGAERLSEISDDQLRKPEQFRMMKVSKSNAPLVEDGLAGALSQFTLPAIHLDFEYLSGVAWPLHIGTKPHQRVPFQFSAHRLNQDLSFDHIAEYLAEGTEDPSREFAERLIALLKGGKEPIVAYSASSAEIPVLNNLIDKYANLADDLQSIIARIIDIKSVVQKNILLPDMITKAVRTGGSLYTLKSVAPALAPGFTYDDLDGVSNGTAAVEAYYQMVTGELPASMTRGELRASMLAYCKKDTEATVVMHQALIETE